MKFSPIELQSYLPQSQEGVWWIALSGGLDSCVLLNALASLKLPVSLHALHVNHQISSNANTWQQYCADLCVQLNVRFTAVNVSVQNTGRGIEDAAREARYEVFKHHVQAKDFLFTAHHADDQTETILLRLMRGTGPRGLAAMVQSRALGVGILYRPLLNFTRVELEEYARSQGLQWVNDESNENDHYDRNYLRNQVIPLLRERWPHFANKWQQTADLCAANEVLIGELAEQDLTLVDLQKELIGTSINLLHVGSLSVPRRHNLLRAWMRREGLSMPDQHHLSQIEKQIIRCRKDAETQVNWGDVSLRVYRERVYALPLSALHRINLPEEKNVRIEFTNALNLSGGLIFTATFVEASSSLLLKSDLPDLHIRFRQGGERCRPVGRAHSQTLKRLLQDCAVEPWLRESLPLIYSGDNLVAVANLWICENYQSDLNGFCLEYKSIQ